MQRSSLFFDLVDRHIPLSIDDILELSGCVCFAKSLRLLMMHVGLKGLSHSVGGDLNHHPLTQLFSRGQRGQLESEGWG